MFRPSLHGWPFGNAFACDGPELGIGGPPLPELGLAGGLGWAALDRYLRGVSIPRDTPAPEPGDALHAELHQRQIAALTGVWPRIRTWQALPDGSWRDRLPVRVPLTGDDLASRTRSEWRTLRRRLDADEPVLLTLLLRSEGYSQSRAARQVLATGWSRAGRRVTLSIYDPGRPGDDNVELAFNLAGPLDARVSGEPPLRGFFPVAYDRERAPAIRTQSFDDRSVIGLNRKVRGEVSPAAGRKRLDLVGRNERGELLHFRRVEGRHWEGENVTETAGHDVDELHSDPAALQQGGALHVFARSYAGDLLHFRLGRSWSLANRTEHKRAGPRFRLVGRPVPVARPWRQVSVLGRDANGGLVHYHTAPLRGWRAEQVPGDPVAGDPVADGQGDALHVAGVADDGRVLHWSRQDVWAMTDPDLGPGPAVRLAGAPTMVLRDGRVHLFGRDRDDALAVLTLHEDGTWQRTILGEKLAGDPAATTGPAGLHVFAPTDNGVLHAWQSDDGTGWEHEDIVDSRTTLPLAGSGPGDAACCGTDDRLHVFVRRDSRLRVFTWTADADWVVDPVTDQAANPPTLVRDYDGRPHLITTDARGTVRHVENGPWKEPDRVATGWDGALRKGAMPAGAKAEAEAAEAEPTGPEPTPSSPGPTPAEPEDSMVLDFETERRMATPDQAPPRPAPASTQPLSAPASEPAPEPASEPASEPAAEAAVDRPAEANGEFRWEEKGPPVSPKDIEPMDLSLLNTWPPKRRSAKPDAAGQPGGGDEAAADREAS